MEIVDDITMLILDDHDAFRRGFARLDDARGEVPLRTIWDSLALHLEIHAEAEESILYPELLRRVADEDAEEETDDAIRDHNKIRDAIDESRRHPVDSSDWWKAVRTARTENSEHLAEEEDEVLPDFRHHATAEQRVELGARWLVYYAEHPCGRGLAFRDKDPHRYIEAYRPPG
jgi:Hemerythrin HHE cation binding domain